MLSKLRGNQCTPPSTTGLWMSPEGDWTTQLVQEGTTLGYDSCLQSFTSECLFPPFKMWLMQGLCTNPEVFPYTWKASLKRREGQHHTSQITAPISARVTGRGQTQDFQTPQPSATWAGGASSDRPSYSQGTSHQMEVPTTVCQPQCANQWHHRNEEQPSSWGRLCNGVSKSGCTTQEQRAKLALMAELGCEVPKTTRRAPLVRFSWHLCCSIQQL